MRLLFVEDDAVDRMAFERYVKAEGLPYDYVLAASAAEAKEALAGRDFDMVVTDFDLGPESGYEVLAAAGDLPVVFVTGVGAEEVAVEALKAGAVDYLVKDPQRRYLQVLPLTLEKAMGRWQAERRVLTLSHALRSTSDGVFISDMEGRLTFANRAFLAVYGYEAGQVIGRPSTFLWANEVQAWPPMGQEAEAVHRRGDGTSFPVALSRSVVRDEKGRETAIVGVVRDVSARKAAEAERERLIAELREALAQVKTLQGLVPICAYCKKIRDDKGFWNQVESYMRQHSDLTFSHGICPDCLDRLSKEEGL